METRPEAYFPLMQWVAPSVTVSVRTAGEVPGLVPTLRREVGALDPNLPLWWVKTLESALEDAIGQQKFYLMLLGLFATLAVVLAAVGLYGVVAYLVSKRTREIGIRVALGAGRNDVTRLVLVQGLTPTVIGAAIGVLSAVAGSRVLSGMLYQVDPWDPMTFASGTALLFVVALLASVLPAWSATRIPPTEAIRTE